MKNSKFVLPSSAEFKERLAYKKLENLFFGPQETAIFFHFAPTDHVFFAREIPLCETALRVIHGFGRMLKLSEAWIRRGP